jgi:SAM-dependent methyltransferase
MTVSRQVMEEFAPAVRRVILERLGAWLPKGSSIAALGQHSSIVPALSRLGYLLSPPSGAGCMLVLHPGPLTEALDEFVEASLEGLPRVPVCFVLRCDGVPDPRVALEHAMLRRQWRKHPSYQLLAPYGELDLVTGLLIAAFEPVPASAASEYPLSTLKAERDLHTDMTREPGRRSDAHLARYVQACSFIRPGDDVIDVACGLGYGSHVIAALTESGSVSGVDLSEFAIRYAWANFASADRKVDFRVGNAQDLSHLQSSSVNFAVSVETLEHIPEPAALLQELYRVLAPAGRVYVSVPNDWSDGSGKDPNPFHLHVYDWKTISRQLKDAGFSVIRAWLQDAGGGQKRHMSTRSMLEIDPIFGPQTDGEWLLVLAEKPSAPRPVTDVDRLMARVDAVLEQGDRESAVAALVHAGNNLPTVIQRAVALCRLALIHAVGADTSRSEGAWRSVVDHCRAAAGDLASGRVAALLMAMAWDALSKGGLSALHLLVRHPEAAKELGLNMPLDISLGPDRAFMDGLASGSERMRLSNLDIHELYSAKQWLDAKYHEHLARISELEIRGSELEAGRQWIDERYRALQLEVARLAGR